MRRKFFAIQIIAALMLFSVNASAQYKQKAKKGEAVEPTFAEKVIDSAAVSETPLAISLDDAIKIALSENVSVKVADVEIMRNQYAKKGTYAALFPKIDFAGSYQRTIKRQVMYMDIDMGSFMPGAGGSGSGDGAGSGSGSGSGDGAGSGSGSGSGDGAGSGVPSMPSMEDGLEVGRLNTFSFGITAGMPIINAQLWESVKVSGKSVELAIEKARSSKLETVTQVKQAYFSTLLAKEAFNVYKEVYENAVSNFEEIEKKVKAQKASEMDLLRAKTRVANAVPNVYNAESGIALALWQLKAVMGVDLDMNMDVDGSLYDYSDQMFRDIHENDSIILDQNTVMRQLAIQSEQLAGMIKVQKYANIPTLSLGFNFSYNTMANDVKASQFRWTPYSYVGLSLNIPIFAGGKRCNDIRQAKAQHTELQYQINDTERNLKIAIKSHINTMETNMKSYYAAKEAVEVAQKSYSIVSKSFEVGRSTLLDLNDAQLALTQARLGECQAIYNFVVAKAKLEQTLGADYTTEEDTL